MRIFEIFRRYFLRFLTFFDFFKNISNLKFLISKNYFSKIENFLMIIFKKFFEYETLHFIKKFATGRAGAWSRVEEVLSSIPGTTLICSWAEIRPPVP